MKKTIKLLLIPILILLLVLSAGVFITSKADSDDFEINGTTLTLYKGQGGQVVIPSNVKEIGYRAFADCKSLTAVSIPDNVKTISDSAFSGCTALNFVEIGKNVSAIGEGAFAGCQSLVNISFIDNPFYVCDKGVIYNKDKTELIQYLAGNTLNTYEMPDSVKRIKRFAFWETHYLQNVDCSSSLDAIDDYAFANCTTLQNVSVHLPCRSIGIGAFSYCSSLMQIELPDSMSSFHETAFTGCPTDMIFVCNEGMPAYKYALENGYLTSNDSQINIPVYDYAKPSGSSSSDEARDDGGDGDSGSSSSGTGGRYSFKDVSDIPEGDELSSSVVVSDKVFVSIDGLELLSGNNSDNGNIINSRPGFIPDYAYYDNDIEQFEFTDDIIGIGKLSFARSTLTSVVITDNITEIGYGAFYHCDNLTDVVIPESVTFVGEHAFEYTPWYNNWLSDPGADDFLIVGDGVLIGYKGSETAPDVPAGVKYIAPGVF